jgi:hypothetical protein
MKHKHMVLSRLFNTISTIAKKKKKSETLCSNKYVACCKKYVQERGHVFMQIVHWYNSNSKCVTHQISVKVTNTKFGTNRFGHS